MEAIAPENGSTISLDKGKQAYSIKMTVKIAVRPYCDMNGMRVFMIPDLSNLLGLLYHIDAVIEK